MNSSLIVLAPVAIWSVGWGIVRGIMSGETAALRILAACVAILLGLSIWSIGYLLWLVIGAPGSVMYLVDVPMVLAGGYLLTRQRWKARSHYEPQRATGTEKILLLAMALLAMIAMALRFAHSPDGDWDAYEIWNLHARFLFRDPQLFFRAFDPAVNHPDYPPLLCGMIAHGWTLLGRDSVIVPMVFSTIFTGLAVGIVGSGLAILRGTSAGIIAAMVLLGTPALIDLGASQYADMPIGCILAAAVVLAMLAGDRTAGRSSGLRILSGACAALTACVKNEGIVMLICVAVCVIAFRPRGLGFFAIGVAVPLALLAAFKIHYAPTNDLVEKSSAGSAFSRLMNPHRYFQITTDIIGHILSLRRWNIFMLLAVVIVIVQAMRRRTSLAAAVAMLISVSYYFVYVLTPMDLSWHLQTSLERLMLQLWPLLVLSAGLAISHGHNPYPNPHSGPQIRAFS